MISAIQTKLRIGTAHKSMAIAILVASIGILILSADLVNARSSTTEPKVALTPEEQAWLEAHPVITLGAAHGSYPPAEIRNPDGTWTGFNIDFYEQVSQLLNIKIHLHHGVWAEVQEKAKNRELDGLPIVGKDPNRDVHFNASNTIYPSYFYVFAPFRHNLQIKSFSDLDGMRIGYKRGARPAKTRLEKLPSAVLKPFDSHEAMTQALLNKEIDVIVAWMGYDHWRKNTLQGTIDKIYMIEEYPLDMVTYIRKDWPEIIPIFNKAISVLREDKLPYLINKWFGYWPQPSTTTKVALTPGENAWLAEHPEIVLGTTTEYSPMVFQKADGTFDGMLVDIYEEVSRKLNTRIRLHIEDPWAKVQAKAEKRELDGLAMGGKDPSREILYNATEVIVPTYFSVFARSQDEYPIKRFTDLNGMRIGYKRAARPTRTLLEKLPAAILKPYDGHEALTQALLRKEIDVIVAWISYDHWRKEKLQGTIDNIMFIEEYPIEMVSHIRKDWPELIPILNKTIATLQQDELPRIISKWFGQYPRRTNDIKIALSSEERAWLDKKHTVRVRVSDAPPWEINTPAPQGMVVDYLTIIGNKFGIDFKFISGKEAWIDGFNDMAGEHIHYDLIPAAKRTEERLQYVAMSEPYLDSPWVIFTRDESRNILTIEDLRGRKVAAVRGYVIQERLEANEPKIEQVSVESNHDALLRLSAGEVDAYIGNLIVDSFILQKEGISNIKVSGTTPYGNHSNAVATRKEWASLISIIDKALVSMPEEEKTAIRNKYLTVKFEQGIDKAKVLKWVLIVGGSALGIILIFVFWNRRMSLEISKRKQTELALQQAKDEAEAANQAKSTFLASMSHELRTPLNAILGFSRLLNRDRAINPDQQEKLSHINRSGRHLLAMIDDVLDLSKIEAESIELQEQAFDLVALINEISIMIQSRAAEKGLSIIQEVDNISLPYAKADAGKLRQILINLLNNAVKYTDAGGVTIRCATEPVPEDSQRCHIVIEVADTGPGIDLVSQANIFEPFVQGTDEDKRKGTGLGLSICRKYSEIMGGTIEVESQVDKGSVFRLRFPAEVAAATDVKTLVDEKPRVIGLAPTSKTWRILVADDHQGNRLLLKSLLEEVGFTVLEAEDGAEAVTAFEKESPDFVWMDMRMPVVDGYEATQRIRSLPGGKDAKIAAITASAFKDQRADILAAGCNEVVIKPFQTHDIFEMMGRFLEIEYIYEQEDEAAPEGEIALTTDLLEALPAELLQELTKACLSLDTKAISGIIERIEPLSQDTAKGLQTLLDNFQIGQIRDLIGEIHAK